MPGGFSRHVFAADHDRFEPGQARQRSFEMHRVARTLQHFRKDEIADQQPVLLP